jgi:site-specific recombinase XerC
MTLFELQAWLGHRSPQSTQFYAKISPKTLTRVYTDAGVLLPQRAHRRGPHRP